MVTLADIEGSGMIQNMWFTGYVGHSFILRIFWDGQEHPSVEAPLSAFFGCAYDENFVDRDGRYPVLNSAVMLVAPGRGYNCFFEMPFRKACRITMENRSDKDEDLYYIIGPAVVSIEDNVVSGVDANNNIIAVIGNKSGELSFSGQGAGKSPTASVMFDDLLNTLLYRNNSILYSGVKPFREVIEDNTALYLHLKVNDKPGVIAEIAGLLSRMGINIDKFITRGKTNGFYDAFVFISNENNIDREALVKGLKKQHVRILSLIPIVY